MASKYQSESSEEFTARLLGIVTNGFASLSIAFGIKSGLFGVLSEKRETPMTSQELADAAGLKERYVREWLGAVVTAHIVDVDPATEKYHLPSHRVNNFKAGHDENEVAIASKGIPILSEVFNEMLEVVRKDGPRGLPFAVAEGFTEINHDYTNAWYQRCLCQKFLPSYPEIMTRLESGSKILDLGCGRGYAARLLAQRFPQSHVTGLDNWEKNMNIAKEAASSLALTNLQYVCIDATCMPAEWADSFDYIFIFDVLHDVPRPDKILQEVKRVMKKDGGLLSVVESNVDSSHASNRDNPAAAMLYTASLFHCLPISYHVPGSYGLGVMWGKDRVREFLQRQGFAIRSVSKTPMLEQAHFLCENEDQEIKDSPI